MIQYIKYYFECQDTVLEVESDGQQYPFVHHKPMEDGSMIFRCTRLRAKNEAEKGRTEFTQSLHLFYIFD